ncbi:MAG: N-acetylmuramoyl-L-alanine amidase, partial [Chitinophagaceae bacterium]
MLKKKTFYPLMLLIGTVFMLACPAEAQIPKKIKTIIVDAGHGGSDVGAHGNYEGSIGSYEKNITLAISLKLIEELKRTLPNVKIVPTRTSDITQSVREKARIANENKGDLFICIHADAVNLKTGSRITGYRTENYTTTKYSGKGKRKKKIVTHHTREVAIKEYFKIPTTRKGTSTWIFAAHKTEAKIKAMEDSEMILSTEHEDSSLDLNYNSPEYRANALLYTQNYFKKSYKMASQIQEEVGNAGRPDLGIFQRQVGIHVLQATQMPAVLIETGFISNPDDERYLNSESGQKELAGIIAKAIKSYKDQLENPKPQGTTSVDPNSAPLASS